MAVVVGIGEVLWDEFPGARRLGGAPVNFACHCRQLGARGVPVSCIGRDAAGDEIVDAVTALGVEADYLQRDADAPTGSVQVTLSEAGVPTYVIKEHVAWDAIRLNAGLRDLAPRVDAVCFGSLAQRSEISQTTILQFLALCHPDAVRIFDVNLRQQFFSKALIDESLNAANVLKVSDEELPVLAHMFGLQGDPLDQLLQLIKRYELRLAAYTLGAEGSLLQTRHHSAFHPGHATTVVDTVGAGDSFTATLCMRLLNNDALDVIADHANAVAAYVCSQTGATPALPPRLLIRPAGPEGEADSEPNLEVDATEVLTS